MIRRPNLQALGDNVQPLVRRNFDEIRLYFESVFGAGGSGGLSHEQLSGVTGADVASSDFQPIRHVSNNMAKEWQDHVDAKAGVHGLTGDVVGTSDLQILSGKKFGTDTSYAEFESDGSLRFAGDATSYDDLPPVPISSLRPTGAGADPALTVFRGGIQQYTFAVADEIQGAIEITHAYKEGTLILPHVHWATQGTEGTDAVVRWGLEYVIANASTDFSSAFGESITTYTADITIPANSRDRASHIVGYSENVPGDSIRIGAYLLFRFFRASLAGAGAAPINNPFAIAIGFHMEQDTVGSRQIYIK